MRAVRGETAEEIAGAADALRAAMVPFEHPFAEAIDTCGTGGDASGTFNVSTAAAFVVAAFAASLSWQTLPAAVGALARRGVPPHFNTSAVAGNLIILTLALRFLR